MVLENQNKVQHISTTGNQTTDKPMIQYHETDWEFLKRLASHSQAAIYPDVKTDHARIWFGFPNEIEHMKVGETDYVVGICPEYLDSEIPARWYTYFDIELHLDYDIGTGVFFQREKWRIEQKHVALKHGILVFKYRLRKEESLLTEKKYQHMFVGMSILGTVLEVDGENVKLHLDIDSSQNAEEAYAYQWTPDTGSAMYCMPKVGTKVSLYFPDTDEQTARAIGCVRENGGSCPAMSDPSKRGLSTEYGKELFLNPEDMGLKSEINQLGLTDGQGVALATMKKVSVTSEKKIMMSGKTVCLETPKELQMARG